MTVLDSLSVASAGENLRTEEFVIALLQEIRQHLGTALIIDHTPSTAPGANLSDYNPYGSVFKRNLARSVIQSIRAPAGGLMLRQKKSNFGPIAAPLGLKVEFGENEAGLEMISITSPDLDDPCLEGIEEHMSALDRTERELAKAGSAGITPADLADALDVARRVSISSQPRGVGSAPCVWRRSIQRSTSPLGNLMWCRLWPGCP